MATRTAPIPVGRSGLRVIPGRQAGVDIGLRQLAWLLLAVFMFFTLIYSRIYLDGAAFEINRLEAQISEQEGRFDELRLEVAQLESPGRIYTEAERMGMVLPDESRTVYAPMPTPADALSDLVAKHSSPLLATVGAG